MRSGPTALLPMIRWCSVRSSFDAHYATPNSRSSRRSRAEDISSPPRSPNRSTRLFPRQGRRTGAAARREGCGRKAVTQTLRPTDTTHLSRGTRKGGGPSGKTVARSKSAADQLHGGRRCRKDAAGLGHRQKCGRVLRRRHSICRPRIPHEPRACGRSHREGPESATNRQSHDTAGYSRSDGSWRPRFCLSWTTLSRCCRRLNWSPRFWLGARS